MRTIKFRAWDNTRAANCSYDTFTLQELLQGRCRNPQDYENWEEFTNLLDKNGKEIYEGDIVREFTMFPGAPIEVVWNNKLLSWRGMIHGTRDINLAKTSYSFEIIGNIYENPELLQDTNSTESV